MGSNQSINSVSVGRHNLLRLSKGENMGKRANGLLSLHATYMLHDTHGILLGAKIGRVRLHLSAYMHSSQ